MTQKRPSESGEVASVTRYSIFGEAMVPNARSERSKIYADGFELSSGYDPFDAKSKPGNILSIHHAVELRIQTQKGITYKIEGSRDLVNWEIVEPNIIGNGELIRKLYPSELYPIKHFRAEVIAPVE